MWIIDILRNVMENESGPSEEILTPAEDVIFTHSNVIMPWLWSASQHGIQSDFVQSIVLP